MFNTRVDFDRLPAVTWLLSLMALHVMSLDSLIFIINLAVLAVSSATKSLPSVWHILNRLSSIALLIEIDQLLLIASNSFGRGRWLIFNHAARLFVLLMLLTHRL